MKVLKERGVLDKFKKDGWRLAFFELMTELIGSLTQDNVRSEIQ